MPAVRRIKNAKITLLSLCSRGANKMPVIYKDGDLTEFASLVKLGTNFDERGEVLAVVYAPDHTDSQGDIANAEAILKMQRTSSRDGFGVDIHHDGQALPKSAVYITENFIVAKGDERFIGWKDYDGNPVDLTGAWAVVLKVEDAGLRKKYRDGEWNGVSMFGNAEVETIKSDLSSVEKALVQFAKHLNKGGQSADTEDTEMKPEELKKALEESNATLATTVATAVVTGMTEALTTAGVIKAAPKPGEKAADEIAFEGDRANLDDVRKHRAKVEKAALAKDVKWDDPASVAAYEAKLEKLAKSADGNDGDEGDSDEVTRLKNELRKAQGRSQQPSDNGGDKNLTELQKSQAQGSRIAKMLNERRGFATAK